MRSRLRGELRSKDNIEVQLVKRGPQGPQGKSLYELWLDEGNQGSFEDFLSIFGGDSLGYIHHQIQASNTWVISHTLNKYPSVSIVDTAGNLVMGEVTYINMDNIEVKFTESFSGRAYLN